MVLYQKSMFFCSENENGEVMDKKRQATAEVLKRKDRKSGRIMVFTGARQVGKTTLVRQVLNDYVYLSIEDPVASPAFLRLTAGQWHELYPKAILDEVQKLPELVESIKSAYDQFPDVRYVLLGSSQLLLLQKVKESLAGRCTIFTLYPLTLPELLTNAWDDDLQPSAWQRLLQQPDLSPSFWPSFTLDPAMPKKAKAWAHYLKFGGYPALVDEDMTDEERYLWLKDYVRTYLERDVRDLASFRDLEPYVKLQKALALQTGQTVNVSALATALGMSSKTVSRYMEYLKLSFQTLTLQPWERNANKRLAKMSKVHYLDHGVLQAVLQKRGGMTGAEFESLVVSELYKQAQNVFSDASFYHLRTHDGKEVDLLVEVQDGYFAFEIKMAEHVAKTDARHLRDLEAILDKPVIHAFVLSNDMEIKQFDSKITAVNVAAFLS